MIKDERKAGAPWSGKINKLNRGLILAVFLGLLFLLLFQWSHPEPKLHPYSGTNGYEQNGWSLTYQGQTMAEYARQPGSYPLEYGKHYLLSTTLGYDGRNDPSPYVFFSANHIYCRIFLEEELLFEYVPKFLPLNAIERSTGNLYFSVPIPRDCLGKSLTIECFPAIKSNIDFQLPLAFFGDYPTMMYSIFKDDMLHNSIAMIIGFLGLVLVLYSVLSLQGSDYRKGLSMGLFSTVFSVFSFTESIFVLHVVANPYQIFVTNLLTLGLMPVLLLLYFRENFTSGMRKIFTGLIWTEIGLWAVQLVANVVGIRGFQNFLGLTQMIYLLTLGFLLVTLSFMKKGNNRKFVLLQLLPVAAGLAADLAVSRMHLRITRNNLEFTSMGMILFIFLEIHYIWKNSVQIYSDAKSSRYYKSIALVDPLTGIGNRRAFELEKENLLSGEIKCNQVTVVSADVNNLKQTNDTMGHDMGDRLIRMAGKVLQEFCRDRGEAFRTGGDEFILLLWDLEPGELENRLDLMEKQISGINKIGMFTLSIALGTHSAPAEQISQAILEADKKMYENKVAFKARSAENLHP